MNLFYLIIGSGFISYFAYYLIFGNDIYPISILILKLISISQNIYNYIFNNINDKDITINKILINNVKHSLDHTLTINNFLSNKVEVHYTLKNIGSFILIVKNKQSLINLINIPIKTIKNKRTNILKTEKKILSAIIDETDTDITMIYRQYLGPLGDNHKFLENDDVKIGEIVDTTSNITITDLNFDNVILNKNDALS
jgi:hypothetical protein